MTLRVSVIRSSATLSLGRNVSPDKWRKREKKSPARTSLDPTFRPSDNNDNRVLYIYIYMSSEYFFFFLYLHIFTFNDNKSNRFRSLPRLFFFFFFGRPLYTYRFFFIRLVSYVPIMETYTRKSVINRDSDGRPEGERARRQTGFVRLII